MSAHRIIMSKEQLALVSEAMDLLYKQEALKPVSPEHLTRLEEIVALGAMSCELSQDTTTPYDTLHGFCL